LYRSEIFIINEWRDHETIGSGRLSSLKMAPFDKPYDFLLVRRCKYSSILYKNRFWAVRHWLISWPWNLG